MDNHYDFKSAESCINEIMKDRIERKPEFQAAKIEDYIKKYRIMQTENPVRWRLFYESDVDDELEVVVRIQGIICAKDLPPLDHESKQKNIHNAKFLRQGIQLTGFDAESFKSCITGIRAIFTEFSRHFKEDKLHVWQPDTFTTFQAINLYNHYFYTSKECKGQASIPFGHGIDPGHVLTSLGLEKGLIHTTDNQVEYYKMNDAKKFIEADPTLFRLGDIVEAHFSYIIIPVKQEKYQMNLVLRGLALLDSSFSNAASMKCMSFKHSSIQHGITSTLAVKRKSCYNDDEEREIQATRIDFQQMAIDKAVHKQL